MCISAEKFSTVYGTGIRHFIEQGGRIALTDFVRDPELLKRDQKVAIKIIWVPIRLLHPSRF